MNNNIYILDYIYLYIYYILLYILDSHVNNCIMIFKRYAY